MARRRAIEWIIKRPCFPALGVNKLLAVAEQCEETALT